MAFLTDRHSAACPARSRGIPLLARFELARQRRALARLDDTRLRDIGLSRADADQEARRSFWDAPAHWCQN